MDNVEKIVDNSTARQTARFFAEAADIKETVMRKAAAAFVKTVSRRSARFHKF